MLALAAFPIYSGYSQTSPAPATTTTSVAPAPSAPVANAPLIMTVPKPSGDLAEVLKLTKAGLGEDVILAYIKNSRSSFNLSANDILHIKDEGISANVITAMLTHDRALRDENPAQPPGQFNFNQQPYPSGQSMGPAPSQPDSSAGTTQIVTPPLVPTTDPNGSQPPPAQVETVPVSPGPSFYWAPGYWGWNGGWIWIGGSWCPRGFGGWGWHPWGWGWRGSGWHGGGWSGGSHGGGSGGWGRGTGGSHH